ncbi:hypothetical protein HDG37_000401 [Paraburkholderia sp. MM5384-R2]|nr:hypothetical protein [Paraburkholderia sp. MM5384-R2]
MIVRRLRMERRRGRFAHFTRLPESVLRAIVTDTISG